MDYRNYLKKKSYHLRYTLSVPFILMMIIPLVILDFFLEIFHNVCFRLYDIPLIKRSDYIKIDRYKLKYLTLLDKINCTYCSYGNGLFHYASTIAGKIENYWCAIKHEQSKGFVNPPHHKDFVKHNDRKAFDKKYNNKK